MAKPPGKAKGTRRRAGLPSKQEIAAFLETAEGKSGKREIARAFNIKGNDKIALKALLKEMAEEGSVVRGRRKIRRAGQLPSVTVIEVAGHDSDGELYGLPVDWDEGGEGTPPRILIAHDGPRHERVGAAGAGDRLLCRLEALAEDHDGYRYLAKPIKKLAREQARLLGIFREGDRGGTILPVDRKQLREWRVEQGDSGAAVDGELVRFDVARRGRSGLPVARVVERLGNPADERKISLIAIAAHGIPDVFPARVLEEVERLPRLAEKGREDLTRMPLVTIDPVDARDHDDAVFAEPDNDPRNSGGFVIVVAIADVAFYVRPGSALDREALKRGNSVYFPDRVVPMLPERISNDLCSLREKEVRPCLAVRMIFDDGGRKRSHRFMRATMRSAAKLAYVEAQAAIDGRPNDKTGPLLESVLQPLWAAYAALSKARDARGPLDLDLPERKILVGADGRVERIFTPERLAAHRLIEEFMIQANVAAAETLEQKRTPLLYRVHDEPSREKLEGLRTFLATLELSLAKGQVLRPEQFNRILAETRGLDVADLVSEVVLRSQSQAVYDPANLGHFGLNLQRYAHFTSPIRRYADLVVHRALIRALGLGEGGLEDHEIERLEEVATEISQAERRAMAAERETADRLIAAHLAGKIGASFPARVSGVTKSGLFIRLDETGADGFIPISTLGSEFFHFDEGGRALVGERSGESFRLGDRIEARLVEAVPSAGALRFEMMSAPVRRAAGGRQGRRPLGKRGLRRGKGRR
ncbi:MAG: ribonuclease R [Hyphomicrobiaceae bacterium]